jgi:pSer/pThr/pTyr-binding forkhead associated (FHA) protein
VNEITLRAPGTPIDALPLGTGMHAIGRLDDGALAVLDDAQGARVCFCVDRRGMWLVVGDGVRGVHVNGRPVQRKALLRVGDCVHVDGHEITLVGAAHGREVPAVAAKGRSCGGDEAPDPRVVLRGVGGRHHGRSFTLDRPRVVGSAADADIRIDDPTFAGRHARLAMEGGRVVLRGLGEDSSVVNGETCREATVRPGDQVVFDAHHRFVVEAPLRALGAAFPEDMPEVEPAAPVQPPARRLPWLLMAALLLAAALSALLLL